MVPVASDTLLQLVVCMHLIHKLLLVYKYIYFLGRLIYNLLHT
jgi:hypothetical protein